MKLQKTIYLSRHGATVYNDKELLQGISDIPLSKKGIEESKQLAERMKNEKLDIIYYTPLSRSKHTADFVNSYHHVPMECIDSFIEMDMGHHEGVYFPEFIEKNNEFYHRWASDTDVGMPGGESFNQVFQRIKPGVEYVLASPYTDILIVAHAIVNRAVLGVLIGMEPLPSRRFRTGNCSISRVMIYESPYGPHAMVDTWNNTSHITATSRNF